MLELTYISKLNKQLEAELTHCIKVFSQKVAEWVSFLDSNEHEDILRKKLKEVANLAIQKLVKYD